jgi:hypothetical protein
MGKATKLLTLVLTDPAMLSWPVFEDMVRQGHTVVSLPDVLAHRVTFAEDLGVDLVLGPTAHFLVPGMEPYVPMAVKVARARKYPVKVKGEVHADEPDQA